MGTSQTWWLVENGWLSRVILTIVGLCDGLCFAFGILLCFACLGRYWWIKNCLAYRTSLVHPCFSSEQPPRLSSLNPVAAGAFLVFKCSLGTSALPKLVSSHMAWPFHVNAGTIRLHLSVAQAEPEAIGRPFLLGAPSRSSLSFFLQPNHPHFWARYLCETASYHPVFTLLLSSHFQDSSGPKWAIFTYITLN